MDAAKGTVDYAAVAQSTAFQHLVERRRRFVLLALGAAAAWFGTFALLASFAHGFMSQTLLPGLSVAYALGLSQFVMVWVITAAYLRFSRDTLDAMEARVVAAAGAPGVRAGVVTEVQP